MQSNKRLQLSYSYSYPTSGRERRGGRTCRLPCRQNPNAQHSARLNVTRRSVLQILHVHVGSKLVTHLSQSTVGPITHPVHHTTVKEGGRRGSTVPKVRRCGVHGEHDVQVALDACREPLEQLLVGVRGVALTGCATWATRGSFNGAQHTKYQATKARGRVDEGMGASGGTTWVVQGCGCGSRCPPPHAPAASRTLDIRAT